MAENGERGRCAQGWLVAAIIVLSLLGLGIMAGVVIWVARELGAWPPT